MQPSLRAWARLLLVLGATAAALLLAVAAARRAPPPARLSFDEKPLRRMQRARPHFVIIGNSMAGTRVDERTLRRAIRPRRGITITYGGSRAPVWYLILKNHVIASGVRPHRVLIFFRYQELTDLLWRESGLDRRQIERASREPDPVVMDKLFPMPAHPVRRLGVHVSQWVPLGRLREATGNPAAAFAGWLSAKLTGETDEETRTGLVNEQFAIEQLRGSTAAPTAEQVQEFSSSVEKSMLPEILRLAREHDIPLGFVRIRPQEVANGKPESPAMRRYIAELGRYIQARGALFVDMTDATWEAAHMYKSGDHIAPRYKARYTRLFVQNLPELFR